MEQETESVKILPRIKVNYSHELYANDQAKSFIGNPMPEGVKLTYDQQPITKNLWEDVVLCFAVDKGDRYELLQNDVLEKNPNLNIDLLHQISVNALVEEIGANIQLHGDPNHLLMVTAGGNFEAAIILIENFWEQIYEMIGGNAVIAIPARDLLFICKEGNQEAMAKMKEMTQGYFDNPETQGLLSKALYLKQSGSTGLTYLESAF
ncbi:MAG: DUF1444 family protein [Flavobacteriales bacterium]|nr:DUF1444 family protein [Flavobacteriales bacterium]